MVIKLASLQNLGTYSPPVLLPWLTHQESLTDKLYKEAGDAQLRLLHQTRCNANWWDRCVLSISEPIFQREILMSAWNTPCWYARTVIPENTFTTQTSLFNRLNNESIGTIIFSEPRIQRASLVNYSINKQCLEYYWLNPQWSTEADCLWVRLSIFTIDHHFPFYLIEILLPGLLKNTDSRILK